VPCVLKSPVLYTHLRGWNYVTEWWSFYCKTAWMWWCKLLDVVNVLDLCRLLVKSGKMGDCVIHLKNGRAINVRLKLFLKVGSHNSLAHSVWILWMIRQFYKIEVWFSKCSLSSHQTAKRDTCVVQKIAREIG